MLLYVDSAQRPSPWNSPFLEPNVELHVEWLVILINALHLIRVDLKFNTTKLQKLNRENKKQASRCKDRKISFPQQLSIIEH